MNPPDAFHQLSIGNASRAFGARTPGVIASRRDLEHTTHDPHRIVGAAIFDEAESHVRGPAKIAIDFFKMSRSMRNRSISCCKREISAAWSDDGSAAGVVERCGAAVVSNPASR